MNKGNEFMAQDKRIFIKKELTQTPPKGCDLKVGDLVQWVNDYGVVWQHRILGFCYKGWFTEKYNRFVHLDTDSYWFPHDHTTLTKLSSKKAA
jgi:hypothetical protein